MNKVTIELYKWKGKFGPFKIESNCGECSLNKKVILKAIEELGEDNKYVQFIQKPWLNYWFKVLLKKGWHPPIIMVNGKVISQKKVLTKEKIKDEIIKELSKNSKIPHGIHIYTLPNCNFCAKAKKLLNRNNLEYIEHNVIENSLEMSKLLNIITGKIHPITMPQIFINGKWIKGYDELQKLEVENKIQQL